MTSRSTSKLEQPEQSLKSFLTFVNRDVLRDLPFKTGTVDLDRTKLRISTKCIVQYVVRLSNGEAGIMCS